MLPRGRDVVGRARVRGGTRLPGGTRIVGPAVAAQQAGEVVQGLYRYVTDGGICKHVKFLLFDRSLDRLPILLEGPAPRQLSPAGHRHHRPTCHPGEKTSLLVRVLR